MPAVAIDRDKIRPNGFAGKQVADNSIRTTLKQGMELGTAQLPAVAKGRPAGSKPTISFSLALACAKLIVKSEAGAARFVGPDGASTPTGVMLKTKDKGFELWIALRKSADGLRGTLEIRGNQFGTPMFSYYGGFAVASYMMLNHQAYKNFSDSVERAIAAAATGDDTKRDQAVAEMSDELAFAMECMFDGADPTGITEVNMDQVLPTDLTQEFAGGDMLPKAFANKAGLDKLRNTKVQAVTMATVLKGNDKIETDYIGDLPYELKDFILRGWHTLMTGPTSTAKTKVVNDVSLHLGAPLISAPGNEGTEDRDLIGAWARDAAGAWTYSYGPLAEAIIKANEQYQLQEQENARAKAAGETPGTVPPALLFADEISRYNTRHQNVFISYMNEHPDGKGGYYHMLRIPETNEVLTCPIGRLVVIGARNYGYAGTNEMDQALVRRFKAKIDLNYLESKLETKLIVAQTGLDEKTVKVLVRAAGDTRTNQRAQLKAPMDTYSVRLWAEQLKYLKDKGIAITDKVVLEAAKKTVYEVVVDRTESGEFDPGGDTILTDNINESWKEVMKK